ncbi:hypothetical protein Brsp01_09240 [Brucella sp. NBRC 12950]|jgi:hypothetical protein|nr:hypothetical protein Brsp01_09240 [Brucella sp. NBRC 12950]
MATRFAHSASISSSGQIIAFGIMALELTSLQGAEALHHVGQVAIGSLMTKISALENIDLEKPGSHNGCELQLMLAGLKPMASFVAEDTVPPELIGDHEFAPYVENGSIKKMVYRNDELAFEMRCYCLPTEEWRGKLSNLIFQLSCEGKLNGVCDRVDRERIDGMLLGYSKRSTEEHIVILMEHLNRG